MNNPFVAAALDIIDVDDDSFDERGLALALAEREPLLSPFNLECAAREALRLAPKRRRESAATAVQVHPEEPDPLPSPEFVGDNEPEMPPWGVADRMSF
jgi:hypothetical protein